MAFSEIKHMSDTQPSILSVVLPVAGLGTRFLPATKAIPKEMLPVLDKPLIQLAVEEAHKAGIKQVVLVTSASKRAIEDHFAKSCRIFIGSRTGLAIVFGGKGLCLFIVCRS